MGEGADYEMSKMFDNQGNFVMPSRGKTCPRCKRSGLCYRQLNGKSRLFEDDRKTLHVCGKFQDRK